MRLRRCIPEQRDRVDDGGMALRREASDHHDPVADGGIRRVDDARGTFATLDERKCGADVLRADDPALQRVPPLQRLECLFRIGSCRHDIGFADAQLARRMRERTGSRAAVQRRTCDPWARSGPVHCRAGRSAFPARAALVSRAHPSSDHPPPRTDPPALLPRVASPWSPCRRMPAVAQGGHVAPIAPRSRSGRWSGWRPRRREPVPRRRRRRMETNDSIATAMRANRDIGTPSIAA